MTKPFNSYMIIHFKFGTVAPGNRELRLMTNLVDMILRVNEDSWLERDQADIRITGEGESRQLVIVAWDSEIRQLALELEFLCGLKTPHTRERDKRPWLWPLFMRIRKEESGDEYHDFFTRIEQIVTWGGLPEGYP